MSHPLPPKALMAAIVSAIFSFWFFRRFNILLSIIHISYPKYHKSFINLQISKQELNFLSIFSFFPISLPSLPSRGGPTSISDYSAPRRARRPTFRTLYVTKVDICLFIISGAEDTKQSHHSLVIINQLVQTSTFIFSFSDFSLRFASQLLLFKNFDLSYLDCCLQFAN